VLLRFINDAYADIWHASGGGTTAALSSVVWAGSTLGTGGSFLQASPFDIDQILHVWATLADTSGGAQGDIELDRVEHARIMWLRANSGVGTYATPSLYAAIKQKALTDATVHRYRLEVWPGVANYFYPISYVSQFTPLNGTTLVTPDVNDIESRDIGLLVAMRLAPLVGRAELVPSIAADISQRTKEALERKFSSMLDAKQNE
jgi:hypothetical protein